MDLVIPANATATLYIPTSRARKVRESGRAAAEAVGVKFLRAEKDAAIYEVDSGHYLFEAPLAE